MRLRTYGALVLMAALSWSCAGGSRGDVLKLGWFGDLSGEGSAAGINELNVVRMLVDEANAAGGVSSGGKTYLLQAIAVDTGGDALKAIESARRLATRDRVVAIIGPASSGSAMPIAPILEQTRVPCIATAASNPKVTVIDGQVKPFMFRVCFSDTRQGTVAAEYAYRATRARKAAILYDRNDEYSTGMRDAFVEAFTGLGGVVAADEALPSGAVGDALDAVLGSIKSALPNVVFMPLRAADAAPVLVRARELGLRATIAGTGEWRDGELLRQAGSALEGCWFVAQVDPADPDAAAFQERYRAAFGAPSGPIGQLTHDAVLLLLDALSRAREPRGEALAEAISRADVQGITGRIAMDPETHGPAGKNAVIVRVREGAFAFETRFAPPGH